MSRLKNTQFFEYFLKKRTGRDFLIAALLEGKAASSPSPAPNPPRVGFVGVRLRFLSSAKKLASLLAVRVLRSL